MKLEDEQSGCLAGLKSSCQDIVAARTLLGNGTAKNGSGRIHSSKDVECVAEIDINSKTFLKVMLSSAAVKWSTTKAGLILFLNVTSEFKKVTGTRLFTLF